MMIICHIWIEWHYQLPSSAQFYRRHEIPGYGHIDCIFGKNAATDVFPLIVDHLERTQ